MIITYALGAALVYAFFRWCLMPVVEALLRIVDPDHGAALALELDEIVTRIRRSDLAAMNVVNRLRSRLGMHAID
jgi:hypothetical protein